ncbi:regulatory protein, Fis family [Marinilactibacillus piezotolerans]|uniref:Regulatory protein, Fis family n=1 Tax=Marinilactibacillus piezotolerans TaxID=258723 RepID=A0A1I4BJK2_9LACT|nr:PrpR N-terminal domain-containing protein [Marinilactibacillus piezotolerans]SFK68693.1 regulatory protein, Fis family [Marinilactibacillus piezotolerans]
MSKINVVGIAPFNGLKISMEHIASMYPSITYTGYIGDLNHGVEIAKGLDSEQVDVILSRGGTALLLNESVNIPVIEIDISIYDILRALRLAQGFSSKMAVVGFENITDRANVLNDLLNLDIEVITIDAEKTAQNVLMNLKNNDYEVIICDQITSTLARKIGLNAILINSVEESIKKSFEQAIKIGETRLKIKETNRLLKSLYEKSPIDILLFDNNNRIVEEFSAYTIPSKLKLKIIKLNAKASGKLIPAFKESFDGKVYSVESRILDDKEYTVYFITLIDINIPTSKSINLVSIDDNHEIMYNSSLSIGIEKTDILNYATSKEAVFIIGEAGTGKDKIAQLISTYANKRRMWEIRCDLITSNEWDDLFSSINSPLQDESSVVHFKGIDLLSRKQLNKFISYANDSLLFKRNKIIFSSTISYNESTQSLVTFFNDWSIIFYTTISLRDRKSDIPSIASLYINEFNNEYGKQIIGFEPKALERLTDFDWPLNQTQFKRVLKQLVIKTNGTYIKDRDTLQQLKTELGNTPRASSEVLQLDQTLDEISRDIIQLVLSEENGNKSKTAERLGISRSTLWRILNK